MMLFICIAVKASSSVHIDSANIAAFALSSEGRHQRCPHDRAVFVVISVAVWIFCCFGVDLAAAVIEVEKIRIVKSDRDNLGSSVSDRCRSSACVSGPPSGEVVTSLER
jgi:hypothetical protein